MWLPSREVIAECNSHRADALLPQVSEAGASAYPQSIRALDGQYQVCLRSLVLAVFCFLRRLEMHKPLRQCKHPGCRMLTSEGYCPVHKPKAVRLESSAWHYLYTDPRYGWKDRRADQLIREPWCRECARTGHRVRATDVDHIEPHQGDVRMFMKGDLQSLCHSCHSRKTMREMNQRRAFSRS